MGHTCRIKGNTSNYGCFCTCWGSQDNMKGDLPVWGPVISRWDLGKRLGEIGVKMAKNAEINISAHSGHHPGQNHVKTPMKKTKTLFWFFRIWGGGSDLWVSNNFSVHWRKSWENHEKKTEYFPKFSQNENIFVKIGVFSVFFSKFSYDFCQCRCQC